MPMTMTRVSFAACLTVLLAACAQPEPPRTDVPGPLVGATRTGSGAALRTRSFADQPPARVRRAPLPPIAQRPPADAGTAAKDSAAGRDAQARITLNFHEAELQGVLRSLAQFTGRNIVVDPRVRGELSLVSDAPVDADTAYAMLLSALRMRGFAVVEVGGVARVLPEADARLQGGPVVDGGAPAASGELATRVFPLRYESATALLPVLRPMVAPDNGIAAHAGNNSLVITDYADNLARLAQVIARLDTPQALNTDVIPIQYGVALDVAALARQMLRAPGGDPVQAITIVADARSNAVLVRASTPERLKLARDLILRIDSPESRAGNLHVVYLRNAQATRLAEVLRKALTGQEGGGADATALSSSLGALPDADQGDGDGMPAGMMDGSTALSPLAASGTGQQQTGFTARGATIQADPSTNTLIISAPDPLYRSLREVIDQLDQRRAQVLVESLIVELSADDAAEFGIQWMTGADSIGSGHSSFFGGANLAGSGLGGNLGDARSTIDALGSGLSLGVVRDTVNVLGTELLDLRLLARAMQRRGGVNILSTPNLMTLDNEEASIIVGQTVPFVTGSYTTTGDGASNPFQTVQREDVGLTLRIRPQISEGGTVKLALYQEVSSLDPTSDIAGAAIITRKRALETNVLVDDGQILVLGGLLEDSHSDTTASVPLLGDIPVLGELFRYQKRGRMKTNLMVFLRPHIVRDADDGARLTLDRYQYMQAAQAGLPQRDSWLLPDVQAATLPALERDADTGLLDLRAAPQP